MQSKVRVTRSRYTGDNTVEANLSKRDTIVPLSAIVNQEGERAIDTAQVNIPITLDVNEGDILTYVQDVANITNLRGIWNFQEAGVDYNNSNKYRVCDESGNNLDLLSTNTSNRFSWNDNGWTLTCNAAGDECIGTTANPVFVGTSVSVLDFSGMFDIWIRFKCSDTSANTKYLLDKENGTIGIAIYMTSGATAVAKVDCYNGGVLSNITGTVQVNDGAFHWIRVSRDENSLLKLQIDGTTDGTPVTVSSDFTNTANKLVFANNTDTVLNRRLISGSLSQIRIYAGGYLSTGDASYVLTAKRQPQTMKFGGEIWKIDDKTSYKICNCKSFAQILLDSQINPAVVTNIYTAKNANQIITDIIQQYTTGFLLFDNSILSTSNLTPSYTATGSLIANIILLAAISNKTFHTSPRRILTVENIGVNSNDASQPNNYPVFRNNINNITDDGNDDTNTVNDIEVVGGLNNATFTENFTAAGGETSRTLTGGKYPYNMQVFDQTAGTYMKMDSSGATGGTFSVDFNAKKVNFVTALTAGHVYVFTYSYDDTANVYFRISDATSIANNGRYFKRFTFPGLLDLTKIQTFATNYVSNFKNINDRHTVHNFDLLNTIRTNYYGNIINNVKKINTTNFNVLDVNGNALNGTNTPQLIKSITWYYPDGKTDIHLGEWAFDAYDLDNATSTKMTENDRAYIKTNNS